jgi:predicted Ser/Thr protein kinase
MTSTPISQKTYGPYEVVHVLGKGAMGMVYLARDGRIGRRVALKVIRLAPSQFDDQTAADDFYRRLQREAEVCGALLHPNIVTLYEAGYENERISYLAMEYVEGETLLGLLNRSGPLTVDTTLAIASDVLRGLEHAHNNGIVHRDIKPANVLLSAEGTAKVADFGIARPVNSSMTQIGALMGTPNYMAPEQVLGHDLTPRADIFSLGVMMFELLTGVKPFAASDLTGTLHNILRQTAPHLSDVKSGVPQPVANLVERMLAKSPEERPSASEALAEVEALRAESAATPSVAPASPGVAAAAARGRRTMVRPRAGAPTLYIAGAGFALLLVVVLAVRPHESASVTIPPEQLREFDAKKHALAQAQALFDAGKYQESINKYDAYLQKYPNSVAAKEGRDRAQQALDRATQKTRRRHKRDEDISPAELLRRLKRAIRGH